MKNQTMPFKNSGKIIRFVMVKNEPWFIAKDICDFIGLQDRSPAVTVGRLDDDEKILLKLQMPDIRRNVWLINESGLYHLVLSSNKPIAKNIQKSIFKSKTNLLFDIINEAVIVYRKKHEYKEINWELFEMPHLGGGDGSKD